MEENLNPVEQTTEAVTEVSSNEEVTEETSKEEGKDISFEEKPKTEPKEQPKEQSKDEKRANYERRIREKHQKELEEASKKSYFEGVKKSTGGVNKFTQEPIEDEEDLADYELMLEIDAKGDDPIEDFHKYSKQKRRDAKKEQERVAQLEAESQKKITDDIDSFVSKHKDIDIQNLLNADSDFTKKFGSLLGKAPLNELYDIYSSYQNDIDKKAEDLALEKDARRASSTGSLGNGVATPKEVDFNSMSSQEFKEWKEKNL